MAEVLGLLYGDGCFCRFRYRGHEVYQVAFTGSRGEHSYYAELVKPTFSSRLGVKGSVYLQNDNAARYSFFATKVAPYLIALGVPVGKKTDASIPGAVIQCGQVAPFIRGLYHAEGSLYRRYSKMCNRHTRVYGHLLVLQIRMKLGTLMKQLREQLVMLGIIPNELTCHDGVYTLRMTNQREIRKFIETIKPRFKFEVPAAKLN